MKYLTLLRSALDFERELPVRRGHSSQQTRVNVLL